MPLLNAKGYDHDIISVTALIHLHKDSLLLHVMCVRSLILYFSIFICIYIWFGRRNIYIYVLMYLFLSVRVKKKRFLSCNQNKTKLKEGREHIKEAN